MKTNGTINFESKLKGMSVIDSGSGEKIGIVSDVVLEPAGGKLLGITFIRADKETLAVTLDNVQIGKDAVMMTGGPPVALHFSADLMHGILASKMLGASVVTEEGTRIGSLESIWISRKDPQLHYRIVESPLQRVLGGGFYLSGQVPRAISADSRRVIVPSDFRDYAQKTLGENSAKP